MITLHGWDVSQQMLLSGIVQGLAYAVLGAGIVLVYRASGVINFAVAAFGTTALAFMAVLLGGGVADWRPPFWLAFVIATVAAALAGSLAEWAVIRRLADAPRLVVLVATIGIAQVLLLVALLLPDVFEGGFFPPLLDWTWTASPELLVQGRDWSVLVVIPVLVLLLGAFLTRTRMGLMVRASAANPEKARLVGIRVFRTANVVWAISAALAAVAAIALAPVRGVSLAGAAAAGGALSYQLLLRALVVALLARMRVTADRARGRHRRGHRRGDPAAERRSERPRRHRAVAVRGDARDRARVLAAVARRSTTAGGRSSASVPVRVGRRGRTVVVAPPRPHRRRRPVRRARAHPGVLLARVGVVPLDPRADLRHRRLLAHHPHRVGRPGVARPVRVRRGGRARHREAGRRRRHPRAAPPAVGRGRRHRRARRRSWSRCSSACPRCASPACTSR